MAPLLLPQSRGGFVNGASKADLARECDQWRSLVREWKAIADEYQEVARRQALQIKELEAVAREAIDYAGQGADPEDPRGE